MRIKSLALCSCVVALLSLSSTANATVINFDDQVNGAVITNQYAGLGATFSTDTGAQVLVTTQDLGSSLPNFICTGVGGSLNCTGNIYVDFATAVSGLSFVATGSNNTGDVGDVRVFAGGTLLGTVDITGNDLPSTPIGIDLTAFTGITRIEIANISDLAGLGFDDFSFQGSVVPGVPEPTSWAMMLLGFGAIGFAMRRTRKRVALLQGC